MLQRWYLRPVLLFYAWFICALCFKDATVAKIRLSNVTLILHSSPTPKTTQQPRTPPKSSAPQQLKTTSVPGTLERPKTPSVSATSTRLQVMTTVATTKKFHHNQLATGKSQVVSTTTKPVKTTTPAPTKPPVCKDFHMKCKRWSLFGYCYNGYVNQYMRKTCARSCGLCDTSRMTGKCRDKFYLCPTWTRFCMVIPSFMSLHCRHSCRLC